MSTLRIIRRESSGNVEYDAKSSGFGLNASWLSEHSAATLARALRGLQEVYEEIGRNHLRHAADLEQGRKKGGL